MPDGNGGDSQAEAEPTVADLLREAMREQQQKTADTDDTQVVDTAAAPAKPDDDAAQPAKAADDGDSQQAADDERLDERSDDAGRSDDAETDATQQALTAPEHWPEEDRDRFAALPTDDDRQWWLNKAKSLERGYQDKFSELADQRKEHAQIVDLFKPHEERLALAGVDRVGAVKRLVAADNALSQNADEVLPWLATQYPVRDRVATVKTLAAKLGVDLTQLSIEAADDPSDPHTEKMNALQQSVDNLGQTIQQNQQRTAQEQAAATVETFRSATDADGNLKHPHFAKVEPTMAALIAGDSSITLDQAYARAVRADDELWKSVASAPAGKNGGASANTEQKKAAVAEAKRASRRPSSDRVDTESLESDDGDEKLSRRELLAKELKRHRERQSRAGERRI